MKSSRELVIVIRRRRVLPGTAISTSWRCLEMSMPTRTRASEVCSTLAMAGLLCGVVRKTTIESRDPVMAASCAIFEAAQPAITLDGASFPRCYGSELAPVALSEMFDYMSYLLQQAAGSRVEIDMPSMDRSLTARVEIPRSA